jgi:hypothetical protein
VQPRSPNVLPFFIPVIGSLALRSAASSVTIRLMESLPRVNVSTGDGVVGHSPVQQFQFDLLDNCNLCLEVEVLTAVVMKSSIFWDITPRSPFNVNRRFGGTCLHLPGPSLSQVRNQPEAGSNHSLRYVPPKRRLTSNGLHGIISQ